MYTPPTRTPRAAAADGDVRAFPSQRELVKVSSGFFFSLIRRHLEPRQTFPGVCFVSLGFPRKEASKNGPENFVAGSWEALKEEIRGTLWKLDGPQFAP